MITLHKTSWYVKLYTFTRTFWLNFFCRSIYSQTNQTTNLCSLIRNLLIGFPLMMLLYGGLAYSTIWVIFIFPYMLWGNNAIIIPAKAILFLAIIFVTLSLILTLIRKLYRHTQHKRTLRQNSQSSSEQPNPGLVRIALRYVKDKHNGVCSIVRFED